MSLPFKITEVESNLNKELLSAFLGEKEGHFHVGPKKYFMRSKFKKGLAGIYNLELRLDDVWLVTFPRSGTTWAQEMVWLINNNLDYETALKQKSTQRFTFLDISMLMPDNVIQDVIKLNNDDPKIIEILKKTYEPRYETLATMNSPRHIKSHFPFSMMPPKLLDTCKVIYVARNPKDAAVSYYYLNHLLNSQGFNGDFPKFWDYFQRDLVLYTPYWAHIEEAWNLRNHPNMLFLFYEDMKMDLPAAIRKVTTFLNKSYNDNQIAKLAVHLDIQNFKNNPSIGMTGGEIKGILRNSTHGFVRQGKSGTWRTEFSPEMNTKAEEWIKENEDRIGIRFQY